VPRSRNTAYLSFPPRVVLASPGIQEYPCRPFLVRLQHEHIPETFRRSEVRMLRVSNVHKDEPAHDIVKHKHSSIFVHTRGNLVGARSHLALLAYVSCFFTLGSENDSEASAVGRYPTPETMPAICVPCPPRLSAAERPITCKTSWGEIIAPTEMHCLPPLKDAFRCPALSGSRVRLEHHSDVRVLMRSVHRGRHYTNTSRPILVGG
jgi:hypothetical protein